MRAFWATILLAVAILLVIWLIAPPDFAGWAADIKAHKAERAARREHRREGKPGEDPQAAVSAPQGALRLVAADDAGAVFLVTGETLRQGNQARAVIVLTSPPAAAAPIQVSRWRIDCAEGVFLSEDEAYFGADGAPAAIPAILAKQSEPLPLSQARTGLQAAARVACGGEPSGVPAVTVTGAVTALAATPSLIASARAMAPRRAGRR